jgi:hypothetical protein
MCQGENGKGKLSTYRLKTTVSGSCCSSHSLSYANHGEDLFIFNSIVYILLFSFSRCFLLPCDPTFPLLSIHFLALHLFPVYQFPIFAAVFRLLLCLLLIFPPFFYFPFPILNFLLNCILTLFHFFLVH